MSELTLEQEILKRMHFHKKHIITMALIDFCDDIYDSTILEKDYGSTRTEFGEIDDVQRAFRVVKDIENRLLDGETNFYEKVYELCWDRERVMLEKFEEKPLSEDIQDYKDYPD